MVAYSKLMYVLSWREFFFLKYIFTSRGKLPY